MNHKLPESERPPFKDIEKRLNDRVSYQYRQLFVQDIQNDCSCPIETYDADHDYDTWYLSTPDKVRKLSYLTELPLPIMSEISDQSILMLLKTACENIGNSPHTDGTIHSALLTNPKSTSNKIIHILEDVLKRGVVANRSGIIYGLAYVDFLPVDEFVLAPEPEFFGAISVNIGGFGAFCFSNHLFKYNM